MLASECPELKRTRKTREKMIMIKVGGVSI